MGMRFSPKTNVGGYIIEGPPLSNGANAVSYEAHDRKSKQHVFLKSYKSPSCKLSWYKDYIAYQKELKKRVENNDSVCLQTYRFLKFFEYQDAPGVYSYCQAFEFLDGGLNMEAHLASGSITWTQRVTFAKLLMLGVRSLHDVGIIHADLKPENIYLIPDDTIQTGYSFKVIDFDRSLLSDRSAPWAGQEGYAGTPRYYSPEHLSRKIPSEASDVFTAAIMLCELLCKGGHPFSPDYEMYEKQIFKHDIKPIELLEPTGSPEADRLLPQMIHAALNPRPEKRPTALQLHEVLKGKLTHMPEFEKNSESPGQPEIKAIPNHGKLRLQGVNGSVIEFNITTLVGRNVLRGLGDDAKYCDSLQFILNKDIDGWKVIPTPGTTNMTLYNGSELKQATILGQGDTISIGSSDASSQVMALQVM